MSTTIMAKNAQKIQDIKSGLQCLRSTKRRTVVWPAMLYVAEYEFRSTVYDISLGGIRLKMPLPLSAGTEVEVKVKDRVRLKAWVMWHGGEFLGLKFRDPAAATARALGDLAAGLE